MFWPMTTGDNHMLDPKMTGCLTVSTEYATRRVKSQQGIGSECLCLPSALSGAGPEANSSGRTVRLGNVINFVILSTH